MPGLIMMSVITNSYSNVASSFFSAKFQRNVEELLVAPVPNYVIIAGYVGGGVARGLCVGLIVTLVSLFFVPLQIHHLFSVCFTVLLTAILFSLGGLINAVFAKTFDDISIIPTFVLTPLTYLGGVFYSISLLPPFWQGVSQVNPIIYMVNAFRYGFLGISDVPLAPPISSSSASSWLSTVWPGGSFPAAPGCATDAMQRAPWGARFFVVSFPSPVLAPSRTGPITALLSRFYPAPCDPPQFSDYPQRYNSRGWKVCTMEALRLFFFSPGQDRLCH